MLADLKDVRLTHQIELEKLYNKNQTLKRIRKEFTDCKEFNFEEHMTRHGIPPSFGFDLLVQMALHRRTTLPILVSILRNHFKSSQETADMILEAAKADLLDWHPGLKIFIVKYTISADVQKELDKFQFPLPMVYPPRQLFSNSDSAYLTSGGSVILNKSHHDDDVCLDHLNRMNRIKFSIDLETATMVKNQWRNLDKPKEGETKQDFEKRKKAFEKYDSSTREVMELLLQEGNEFYLTHKYDKRGRIYCQGYHVDYQGAPWNKAVIELAEKEIV